MEGIAESQTGKSEFVRAGSPIAWPRMTMGVALGAGLALAGGLVLRIFMLQWAFQVNGDSFLYGGIAKNLLLHGRYAIVGPHGELAPTLMRLPGYPLFLAACFRLFGMENYWAAACVQIGLELAGCLLLADFARMASCTIPGATAVFARRAAMATLWLAALCPFTASYAATPLAEAPTLFVLALAMWSMARFCEHPRWLTALAFTFAVTSATLLRPDGALAVIAFAPAMLMAGSKEQRTGIGDQGSGIAARGSGPGAPFIARLFSKRTKSRESGTAKPEKEIPRIALVCAMLALAPFAVWTVRNWQVFHVFQPLAPRLATDPGERTNPGWERWVKSWCLDFVSTYEIYWQVPDNALDVSKLPSRAFDSPAQYAQTLALAREYDANDEDLTPQIDAAFGRLADARIAAHPFRYYVLLPLGRVADMWFRPRVENLNVDLDWWVYSHHPDETALGWFYAALNAGYLLLAGIGMWLRPRFWKALLAYMVLRSALLLTVEAPEARYTIECFPMLFALGGVTVAAWARGFGGRARGFGGRLKVD